MAIDDVITREQLQAYNQVQEKEEQRGRYEAANSRLAGTALFCSGVAVLLGISPVTYVSVANALGSEYHPNGVLTVITVVLACVNAGIAYSDLRKISGNNKEMGRLEREIEQLKAQPEYQAVVSSK